MASIMGSTLRIPFVLVLLLLLGSTQAFKLQTPTCQLNYSWKLSDRRTCKYGSRRISYYPNSEATFQLLLRAGDIHPNPGPQSSSVTYHHDGRVRDSVEHPSISRIHYTPTALHELNPPQHVLRYQHLPTETWKTIMNLGIAKVKKTRRGNKTKEETFELTDEISSGSEHLLHYFSKKQRGLNIAHLNICSLLAKIDSLRDFLKHRTVDLFTISETHLDDTVLDSEICIDGYKYERKDRNRRGGGVGVFILDNIMYNRRNDLEENELESLWIEIKLHNTKSIMVGTFYRPPSSNVQYQSKIEESITKVCELNHEVIVLGDFNFNMNSTSESKFINGICRQKRYEANDKIFYKNY